MSWAPANPDSGQGASSDLRRPRRRSGWLFPVLEKTWLGFYPVLGKGRRSTGARAVHDLPKFRAVWPPKGIHKLSNTPMRGPELSIQQ